MKTLASVIASLILLPMLHAGGTTIFREHIIKEDLFFIDAESQDMTVMGMTGRFPGRYPKALAAYCESVGGVASSMLTADGNAARFSSLKDIDCVAPNGNGFKAKFIMPKKAYIATDYSDTWGGKVDPALPQLIESSVLYAVVVHDSPQEVGYAHRGWQKEEGITRDSKMSNFIGKRDGAIENAKTFPALCAAKGGRYLLATQDSQGYAVGHNEYVLNIAKKVGDFASVESPGSAWCIDTQDSADEFSVKVLRNFWHRGVWYLASSGVDRSQIKYSTDPMPPYLFKASKPKEAILAIEAPVDFSIKASRQPTPPEVDLAKRTLNSKNTALARTGGYVSEGMYLGQSVEGCERAAVARTGDTPVDHKSLYGNATQYQSILNFKQCGNGDIVFAGESVERTIPRSIEPEYKRILGMCKIKGMAMGSYLGYDIDCQRQGSMVEPVYEMTVVKKDKLVGRAYEK